MKNIFHSFTIMEEKYEEKYMYPDRKQ